MSSEGVFIVLLISLILLVMGPFVVFLDISFEMAFIIAIIILMIWSLILYAIEKYETENDSK